MISSTYAYIYIVISFLFFCLLKCKLLKCYKINKIINSDIHKKHSRYIKSLSLYIVYTGEIVNSKKIWYSCSMKSPFMLFLFKNRKMCENTNKIECNEWNRIDRSYDLRANDIRQSCSPHDGVISGRRKRREDYAKAYRSVGVARAGM